jgi:hypothetical protein
MAEVSDIVASPTGSKTRSGARVATAVDRDQGVGLMVALVIINFALAAVQAISAGFLMSGYEGAVAIHARTALALEIGALIQALAAAVLFRRHRVPPWVAGLSIGLLIIVVLQVGFGYRSLYWLHVPIGVGIFGSLVLQLNRLQALRRAPKAVHGSE